MAITAPKPALNPDPSDTVLEFPDNRLLIDLCGELDRNIVQVESRLGVAIHRRGNHLALHGPAPEREAAEQVLRALYARLEQGRPVTPGDIEAAIRLAPGASARPRRPGSASSTCSPASRSRSAPGARSSSRAPPRRRPTSATSSATSSSSGSARPAPARPTSRWRWRPRCASSAASTRIILSRPAVEAGERLGFLPGDMKEKVDPYLRPLYDALYDLLPLEQVAQADRGEADRDRAAGLHARPDAGQRLRHPRRGAEHDDRCR